MFENKRHFIGEVFECNKRTLLGYFTRRVGREAASDLLQETFVRFIRYSQSDAVADAPPFLQQIAINLARDHARRRKTEAKYLEFGDLPEDVPTSEAYPVRTSKPSSNGAFCAPPSRRFRRDAARFSFSIYMRACPSRISQIVWASRPTWRKSICASPFSAALPPWIRFFWA
jgi:DNA-directed RNA polymerase specialized sigma24 family protein